VIESESMREGGDFERGLRNASTENAKKKKDFKNDSREEGVKAHQENGGRAPCTRINH